MSIKFLSQLLLSPFVFIAGLVSTTAAFGIILGIAWLPATKPMVEYKLVTGYISAAIGIVVGSAVYAYIAGKRPQVMGLVFGIAFGIISSVYLLGEFWTTVVMSILAAAAGLLGGNVVKLIQAN